MSEESKLLEQELLEARYAYYNLGTSKLTDGEYDVKEARLKVLDPNCLFFTLKGDGFVPVSNWEKVAHDYHVCGQFKAKVEDEIVIWQRKYPADLYLLQDKLDGISIVMTYENGMLKKAITRGDESGDGEDIYKNVRMMKGVPFRIAEKKKMVVRGEIVIKHNDFKKLLNEGLEYKNPRNTTTGIAKRYDGKYANYLTVITYTLVNNEDFNRYEENLVLEFLESYGFETVQTYFAKNVKELVELYNTRLNVRDSIGYDVDGVVIKTNDIQPLNTDYDYVQNNIAWKYPSQSAPTIIKSIGDQVSGCTITPVAFFDPVEVNGVTIKQATLHNYPMAIASKVGVGSKVEITRRNDVIPKVETVFTEGDPIITVPTCCPECGGEVAYEQNSEGKVLAFLLCMNVDCPAKVTKQIVAWLVACKTKGIAEKTVEALYENGIIKTLEDFLTIDCNVYDSEILALDGFEIKKLKTLKKEIAKTKNIDLLTFLDAMNFRGFGLTAFENIISHMRKNGMEISLSKVIEFIESPDCFNVKGLNTITISSLRTSLSLKKGLIETLLSYVTITVPSSDGENKLNEASFCVTGNLSIDRDAFIVMVKKYGGVWKSGVSSKLDYLVTNDGSTGSSKIKNAIALGIKVISEQEFYDMVGGVAEEVTTTDKIVNDPMNTNRLVDLLDI